uniref:X-ray radiation resistance-associated protein 1 n=1 Tax=Castor canadensis TaxID=51338 RepID=A0A8C0X029_CASCN
MASSGIYKLDDGKPHLSNCFPAKSLLRIPEEGRGHWLVTQKGSIKRKPKSVVEAPAKGQESEKKVSFETGGRKASQQESQVDITGHILDQAFLVRINASWSSWKHHNIFLSPLQLHLLSFSSYVEAFHTFTTVYVKYGDFKPLQFLDLSFNSLTTEAVCDLGICHTYVSPALTGNGLTSLPPSLAVTEQEASVTSLTSKKYILRFPALETLMLDDNKLSNPNCFASLAGLRRLKKLSLDQNKIFRIPYLQQVQLRDGSGDGVGGRASPQKEPQAVLQSKSWMFEASDAQPDYTILPMRKDVDRTEVVFSSYPGFSTSETTKVCSLPPIFEILPVKSLKARNQTLAPPFPELRYLSLAYNKIAKEDAILPVALFPSLRELIFHNNPLVSHTRGVPPLLKSFLQERLGIRLIRRKLVKSKHHILMPRKESRKVSENPSPQGTKQPVMPRHLSMTTAESPLCDVPEPEAGLADEPPPARSTAQELHLPIEGPEGLSLSRRPFVPMPPICSDSTVHSEETASCPSDTVGRHSPDHLSDEDAKSTESIFLTQVSELPSSVIHRDDLQVKEKDQRRPPAVPREVQRTRRMFPSASTPSKYHGYEELLTAKPDPAFTEPKGIQKNAQALQRMLKCPLLCRSSKAKLDAFQKPYIPKERRAVRVPIPPPRKTRAQLLDDILVRMRDSRNLTEAPLGAVLRGPPEQRLVNQKQYLEAKRLLKEFRARYRRLVRGSLRKVFGAGPPQPALPALGEGQPKFGRFLEFMDEFCLEPMASDSQG